MASDAEIAGLTDIPGYKVILKAVLKTQIQGLVEQLSTHTDEESVLITANVTDGTISHLGSHSGQSFLTSHDDFKSQFMGFLIKRQLQQTLADPTHSTNTKTQKSCDELKSDRSHKVQSRGNKQRPGPYNVINRSVVSSTGKTTMPVSSQDREQGPSTETDSNTLTFIVKQEPKSDDENSSNFVSETMETESNIAHNDVLKNISEQSGASWIEPVCNDHLLDNKTGNGHQLNITQNSPAGPVSETDQQEIDDLLANTSALKFSMKRKLNFQTYETKYAAILEVERGQKSKTQIARQFKVPMTTLITWLKHKNVIKQKMSGNISPHRKSDKKPYFHELDKKLHAWYLTILDRHIQVNGMILREKACHFAKEIGMQDFQFGAAGWVERFKARHGISFKRLNTKTATEICSWTVKEEGGACKGLI